jgi:hypothetical protein
MKLEEVSMPTGVQIAMYNHKSMKKQGMMTPLKLHNSLITEHNHIEIVEMPDIESKSLV